MRTLKTLVVAASAVALMAFSFSSSACKGGDANDCDALSKHVISLLPPEMTKDMSDKDKAEMVAECEKASPEERKCAMAAKDMAALGECEKSTNKTDKKEPETK